MNRHVYMLPSFVPFLTGDLFLEFKNEPKICEQAAKIWEGGHTIVYDLQISIFRSCLAPRVHVSTCVMRRLLASLRFQARDEVYASPAVVSLCYTYHLRRP